MGIVLGLVAAVCYGVSDFAAGVGGRRADPDAVAVLGQLVALASTIVVVASTSSSPGTAALLWGALSGVGSGIGTLALYRGLTVGRMGVVAPLSAVLAAAIPAIVGLTTGDSLSAPRFGGLVLALPAIALVARTSSDAGAGQHRGVVEGLVAGAGFGLLFVGLARAGTAHGAWPLLPGQAIAVLTIALAVLLTGRPPRKWRAAGWPALVTGLLAGGANIAYLAATGAGELSVVAVLTSLYPAVTILLARTLLHEGWARTQVLGLSLSAVAVGLITVG